MSLKTPELRSALVAFGTEALSCANPDISQMRFDRFRLQDGLAFELTDNAIESQKSFTTLAIKKLGPIKGHAKVLDKALWKFVVSIDNVAQLAQPAFVDAALDIIEKTSASVCEFFRPCPLVTLPEEVDCVKIGRVGVDRTEARLKQFRKINKNIKFGVAQGWALEIVVSNEDAGVVTQLPPVMWSINLVAADPVKEEEALWLTDVALSLLTLSVDFEQLGFMAPRLGDVEPHPFLPHDHRDHSFTLKEDGGAQLGGMTAGRRYDLTVKAVQILHDQATKHKFDRVFDAKPKSLAEQFYQGCGWLTRGRRSKDRSDRLLYFFTAIEALLSNSDKTSPVIQTIARHAALLITDKNEDRHKIAQDIKSLYGKRSALVHTGARGALDVDANKAEHIADLIFTRVWRDIDLSLSHQDFSSLLGRASFGLPLQEASDRI